MHFAQFICDEVTCPEYRSWKNPDMKLVSSSESSFRVPAGTWYWRSVSSCFEALGRQTAHFLTAEGHSSVNNIRGSCLEFRVSVMSCPLMRWSDVRCLIIAPSARIEELVCEVCKSSMHLSLRTRRGKDAPTTWCGLTVHQPWLSCVTLMPASVTHTQTHTHAHTHPILKLQRGINSTLHIKKDN